MAEEAEALVGKFPGGAGGVPFNEVEGEEVFPGGEGLRGDEGGLTGKGGGLPDDKGALGAEAGGGEEGWPIQAGSLGGEVRGRPGIVGVLDIFAVGERDVSAGDGGLKGEDAVGPGFGIGETGELEHGDDVGFVFRAGLLHGRRVGEVVVAIGEGEAALEEVGCVVVGIVEPGSDPETEDVLGVVVGVVEGVDISPDRVAEGCGEIVRSRDGIDLGESGCERCEAVSLDGGLVHVGAVEVGNLFLIGVGRGVWSREGGGGGFPGVVDDAGDLLEGPIGEGVEDAE